MPDWNLKVTAALLRCGAILDRFAGGLAMLGMLLVMVGVLFNTTGPHVYTLAAVLFLLGVVQKYWALRVALDAELFAEMANAVGEPARNAQAMDRALLDLGLLSATRAGRPWAERCRGALRLLRIQAMLCALQLLLALAGLLFLAFHA
jgi:hypothetical protein